MDTTVLLTAGEHGTAMVPTDAATRADLAKVAAPQGKINQLDSVNVLTCAGLKANMLEAVGGKFFWKDKITYSLPSDYAQVEYIESSGTQYIDTGYQLKNLSNYTYYLDFTPLTTNTNTCECGTSKSSYWSGQRWGTSIYIGTSSIGLDSYHRRTANVRQEFLHERIGSSNTLTQTENGVTKTQTITLSGNVSSGTNWYVFAYWFNNSVAGQSKIKLYRHWLIDGATYAFDLVPVKRLIDNEYGMYDLISNTFYRNDGSGAFTGGSGLPSE